MVESSKILTVSYGTFSCTLEGFEDSFSTMKAIAEYFRDLAAEDRYFGAEPPTPDAEMLTRIAEREISRRVEAHADDNGIVLRAAALPASDTATPGDAGLAQTMPPQAQVPASFDAHDLAEANSRSSQDHTPSSTTPATAGAEETATGSTAEEVPSSLLAATDPVAPDTTTEQTAGYEAEAIEEMDEAAESPVTFEDMGVAPLARQSEDLEVDSVAAKLQRIRAVVGTGAAALEPVDQENAPDETALFDAEDETETLDDHGQAEEDAEAARAAEEAEAQRKAEEEAEAARAAEEAEAQRKAEEEAEAARAAEEAEAQRMAEEEAEAARAAEEAEAQRKAEEEAEAARAAEEAEAQRKAEEEAEAARAAEETEAQRKAEEEAEAARAAEEVDDAPETNDTTNEDVSDEVEVEEEAEVEKKDSFAARILRVARLKASSDEADTEAEQEEDLDIAAQDGAHDLVEFDDVRGGDLSPEDEAELQEELADVEREAAEDRARGSKGRDVLPETDDAAMSRILSQTDAEMSEPEGSRRRQAIAQLKAAVAATEAARQLGEGDASGTESETAFRDDLDKVVRPRRAPEVSRSARTTERPRPAPLKLVASQRIDHDPATPEATSPVQPRRVTSRDASASDTGDFAAFAAEMGATELPDLLEAAAAYTAYVEGIEDFSRPQILKKVQLTSKTEISREDSLRSFGTLLREGRINKASNGRFQVSEETRFKPEAKAG